MVESSKKNVLVPIAEGFEEIETVAIINILRRAGAIVTIASIMGKEQSLTLKGSNGISILTDCYYEDCDGIEYDMIALPGGVKNA
jgi:4-methyl-5(b-hydroxyethyl)-thiazole monophosphate biosynthesis